MTEVEMAVRWCPSCQEYRQHRLEDRGDKYAVSWEDSVLSYTLEIWKCSECGALDLHCGDSRHSNSSGPW